MVTQKMSREQLLPYSAASDMYITPQATLCRLSGGMAVRLGYSWRKRANLEQARNFASKRFCN